MFWLLLLLLLLSLSGFLLEWLLGGRRGALDPERLAAAPLLGTALTGASLLFFLLVFDKFLLILLFAVPALLLAACFFRRKALPASGESEMAVRGRDAWFIAFTLLFIGLVAAATFKDGARGDYLSIWAFKALVLMENDGLRIPSFFESPPLAYHHHQDYPLLFPALQAAMYRLSGDVIDRTAKLFYPLLLASASLALYFHFRKRGLLASALVGSLLLLTTPALCGVHPGVCSAYMDVPLGCFTLMAFLSAMDWLQEGRRSDGLRTGLYLLAMALTKNEGMAAAALAIAIILAAAMRRAKKQGLAGFAALLLPLAAVGGAWFLFRLGLPKGHSDYVALFLEGRIIEKSADLPAVTGRFFLEFIHFERWGFLWVLLAVSTPWWVRKATLTPFAFLAVMTLVLIAAVTVSPLGVEYQTASAVPRLVSQLAPLAAACAGLAFKRNVEGGRGEERSPI